MSKYRPPKYIPPTPLATCPVCGKNQYVNETEAWRAGEYQEKCNSVHLWVYKCGDCDFWHLTSNPPGAV